MIDINQNFQMIKNQNYMGGICMILSVSFFSLMDVLIKILMVKWLQLLEKKKIIVEPKSIIKNILKKEARDDFS